LFDYQQTALSAVRAYAKARDAEYLAHVQQVCEPLHVDAQALIDRLRFCDVTVNFHPDRLTNNGKTVLENLLEQGLYHGQFRTGTSNGGLTTCKGRERYMWEQRLFFDAYPPDALDRPKYGALNLFHYIDGASARFGACHFILKRSIIDRCTFAYGDSSSHPTALCTSDSFACIVAELLDDVRENRRMLNRAVSFEEEAIAILLHPHSESQRLGRNLDFCIETHIHGDIRLDEDVDSFYMDESFMTTDYAAQAARLCDKFGIALRWIPQRQLALADIGDLFRGPRIPVLARKIDALFGNGCGVMNAALLGEASRDSMLHPEAWSDVGTAGELFQYCKQLWHTLAYFG